MNARGTPRSLRRWTVDLLTVRAVLSVALIGAGVLAPVWSLWAALLVGGSAANLLAGGLVGGMIAVLVGMVIAP